jgi:hypothetical protein
MVEGEYFGFNPMSPSPKQADKKATQRIRTVSLASFLSQGESEPSVLEPIVLPIDPDVSDRVMRSLKYDDQVVFARICYCALNVFTLPLLTYGMVRSERHSADDGRAFPSADQRHIGQPNGPEIDLSTFYATYYHGSNYLE